MSSIRTVAAFGGEKQEHERWVDYFCMIVCACLLLHVLCDDQVGGPIVVDIMVSTVVAKKLDAHFSLKTSILEEIPTFCFRLVFAAQFWFANRSLSLQTNFNFWPFQLLPYFTEIVLLSKQFSTVYEKISYV